MPARHGQIPFASRPPRPRGDPAYQHRTRHGPSRARGDRGSVARGVGAGRRVTMDRRRSPPPPRESPPPPIDEARLASLVREMYNAREADVTPPREMQAKLARRLDTLDQ